MMEATFQLESIGDIKASLTVTMSISEWQRLRKQIAGEYPGWQFTAAIDRLVCHATAKYSQQDDGKTETA